MAGYETLELAVDAGVARLMLNRPARLNALNRRMAEELIDALAGLATDEAVRVLVLHGASGHFCAGGDVRAMGELGERRADEAREGMALYQRLTEALHGFARPVIAAVDGVAYGAGFSLMLLADLVLLGDGARLSMVFGRVGLVPDCGALYTLPRAVGVQRAKELVFSARELGPAEAVALGLALRVEPGGMLLERALALAQQLACASPLAQAQAKRLLNGALQAELPKMLAEEGDAQAAALCSPYHREAVRRFLAKEPPLFP